MALSKATRNRTKQTRLQFAPLPSSSPVKDRSPNALQDRLAHVRYDGESGKRIAHRQGVEVMEEGLPTPDASSQAARGASDMVSSPLSDPPSSPVHELSRSPSAKPNEDEDDDAPIPPSKRRISRRINGQASVEDRTPSRRSSRLQTRPTSQHRESSSSVGSFVPVEIPSPGKPLAQLGSPETSGDEDVVMVTRPAARRKQSKLMEDDEFVVNDDRVEYISSDEEPARMSPTKRRRSARDDFIVDSEVVEFMTSDDEPATPTKARKLSRNHKSPKTPRRRSRKEQEELEDDLVDLRDSDSATKQSRTRGGPVTTQRDKAKQHLELLKRRRAGEKVPRVEDADEEDEPEAVDLDFIGHPADHGHYQYHSDQGSAHSSVDTEPEVSDNGADAEDNFIEDDTPGGRRLPHPDIPLEFTSYASAKPKELFPYIIEWLVKNKIAPAFARDDPIWRLAFGKVNDQVQAQAGSRLISAAWNGTFKYAVLARPSIKVATLSGFYDEEDFHTCDACNKPNHPALYDFVFSGQAYNKDTLEPVENDDSDVDDEQDTTSHDEQGHALAPSTQHFYLGRFCAANAEMGHKLTHWKFHLNERLLAYLEEQDVLSARAIIAREKLNKKKREKEAESIVDSMEETGMIAQLWRGFQNDLEDARLGMEGYEKKGGRSRGRIGAVRSSRGDDGVVREWKEENGRQIQNAIRVGSDSDE